MLKARRKVIPVLLALAVVVTMSLTGVMPAAADEPPESDKFMVLNPDEPISFPEPLTVTDEIAYDDGNAENAISWTYLCHLFAVRFTPPYYPAVLDTARICLWPDDWPDSDHEQFAVEVYDDDGPSGAPGTLLGTVNTTATHWGWWDVDISGLGITIDSGDFYIAYHQLTDMPDSEGLCMDTDDPDGRSWARYEGSWEQIPGPAIPHDCDWMIRCVVAPAPAVPAVTQWGIIGMAIVFASGLAWAIRRRQTSSAR